MKFTDATHRLNERALALPPSPYASSHSHSRQAKLSKPQHSFGVPAGALDRGGFMSSAVVMLAGTTANPVVTSFHRDAPFTSSKAASAHARKWAVKWVDDFINAR